MTTTTIPETAAPTRAGPDIDEPVGVITGTPRTWLRLEGLTLVIGALAGFTTTGKTWWLVPALLLLPDAAALGYIGGGRTRLVDHRLNGQFAA
jgi:Domain of unknown function (DUF4260)